MRTEEINYEHLLLDNKNPRLPEALQGGSQSDVFSFLEKAAVINELVDSMLDNGYFAQEPLVVLEANDDGFFIVLEGNRRLAALMVIHNADAVSGYTLTSPPKPEQIARLQVISCFVVESREDVSEYLGFRHIGGLKQWSPEAKSRYVIHEVERLHAESVDNPFYEVGRRVGSNAPGIRNAYIAMKVLLQAREEGVNTENVEYVLQHRFGVWYRCMISKDIKSYICLNPASTYDEVQESVRLVSIEHLEEVIADLTGSDTRKSVLYDSRLVTEYGLFKMRQPSRH